MSKGDPEADERNVGDERHRLHLARCQQVLLDRLAKRASDSLDREN